MMGYGFMQDGLRHVCCVCVVRQHYVDLPRSGIIPTLCRGFFSFKSFGAFMHDNSAAKVEVLGGFLRGLRFGFGRDGSVRGGFALAVKIAVAYSSSFSSCPSIRISCGCSSRYFFTQISITSCAVGLLS